MRFYGELEKNFLAHQIKKSKAFAGVRNSYSTLPILHKGKIKKKKKGRSLCVIDQWVDCIAGFFLSLKNARLGSFLTLMSHKPSSYRDIDVA